MIWGLALFEAIISENLSPSMALFRMKLIPVPVTGINSDDQPSAISTTSCGARQAYRALKSKRASTFENSGLP